MAIAQKVWGIFYVDPCNVVSSYDLPDLETKQTWRWWYRAGMEYRQGRSRIQDNRQKVMGEWITLHRVWPGLDHPIPAERAPLQQVAQSLGSYSKPSFTSAI